MTASSSLRRHHSSASSNGNKKRKSSDASETKANDNTTPTAVIPTTQMFEGSRQSSLRRNQPSSSSISSGNASESVRWQPARVETVCEKRNGGPSQPRSSLVRCHLPDVSTSDKTHQPSSPIELTEVDLTVVEEVPVLQRLPSVTTTATAATRPKKPHRVCKVL